ncbi:hypothetical protein AAIR98_000537 [Elusimicrobium simillimum]|uniref:hypothetical protein n=1 Tax=Elusimicrobium simillimum TaxID=3143438 RepID=UPI003C6EB836
MKLNFLRKTMANNRGLTKKEVFIAVILIAVLGSLSAVKFVDINNKCKEGSTKYNLSRVRSAIAAYYGDHQGTYPTDNLSSLVPQYIEVMPHAPAVGKKPSNKVHVIGDNIQEEGGWIYNNDPKSEGWGDIYVNSAGTDSSGKNWKEN